MQKTKVEKLTGIDIPYKLKPISSFWVTRIISKFVRKDFWITIGDTVYYPDGIIEKLTIQELRGIIKHEGVHVTQYEKYGIPLYLFLYFFVFFPIFFSYFKWKFEREAYKTQIKNKVNIDIIVKVLWKNCWMPWPKSWMRKWFEKELSKR